MSSLARYFSARRTYSSFFSNKPGGGRYFNSAKPPKAVGVSSKRQSTKDGPDNASQTNAEGKQIERDESTKAVPPPAEEVAEHGDPDVSRQSLLAALGPSAPLSHPAVSPREFKLNQFFSVHRPLLLLSEPSSILHNAPASGPLYSTPSQEPTQDQPSSHSFGQNAPDPAIDADAETARQLSRSLTLSRAGSAIAWENTLRRLGLDVSKDTERVDAKLQMAKDWEEVLMDSTKRKKKKKMKKHKLKKRRRLTRQSRLKDR